MTNTFSVDWKYLSFSTCFSFIEQWELILPNSRCSQSIKIGTDLSIDKSIKVGKFDLIDIDFMDQSVEIDDMLICFIDFLDLYRLLSIFNGQLLAFWNSISAKKFYIVTMPQTRRSQLKKIGADLSIDENR